MEKYIRESDAVQTVMEKPDMTPDEKAGIIRRLKAIPAADVSPVRHGRWVGEKYVWQGLKSAQCNQCKRKTDYYIQPNYCHSCGAKMDGGRDDVG